MGNPEWERALRALRDVAQAAASLEEQADQALYELASRQGNLPASAGEGGSPSPQPWPSPAEPAEQLTVDLLGNGRSRVHCRGCSPLDLPRALTLLLLQITLAPPGADGIVSLRPAADVAAALGVKKSYVFKLAWRLRERLEECGWNPSLVETRRSKTNSAIRLLARKITVTKAF
jgi:hypothetical protein